MLLGRSYPGTAVAEKVTCVVEDTGLLLYLAAEKDQI